MALEDYRDDFEMCCRCSACKFIPFEKVTEANYINVCPSIARYNFHSYSGGGKLNLGAAILENKLDYTQKLLDVIYNCQMCGACDVSCKYAMDMEVLEPMYELRIKCVEDGQINPNIEQSIDNLRKNNTLLPMSDIKRSQWAEGLNLDDYTSQKIEVIFHAGCRTCFDQEMWQTARSTISIMQKAGINAGIAGEKESCCGGRAFQMGYREDFLRQARHNLELFKQSGAKTLVTGCADCYHAFKVLYDQFNLKLDLEVLHITEFLDRLIKEAKIKPSRTVDMTVTYQDPCHLGRLGEPFIHWKGERIPGHIRIFSPTKVLRRGSHGVYEPPRNILNSIPGLQFIEMPRTKEYSWCCGAGGGVQESNPEFARWTAQERISEAKYVEVEAIVTACPGCKKQLEDTVRDSGNNLKVYDVVEILEKSI